MRKDKQLLVRRQKDIYEKVRIYKGRNEKVIAAIMDFAEDHYMSTAQAWKDYQAAIKTYGKIVV